MAKKDVTIWGIHAGEVGQADSLFLKEKKIAIGWAEMGDLSKIKPDQEAFKEAVAEAYPEAKPGAIPNYAGQLLRFAHGMHPGDLVVYRSKLDKQIHIGKVAGGYEFRAGVDYPHRRSVAWAVSVSPTQFSQGALYEIGSALTLFQVKNYADDFAAALEGKPKQPSGESDDTVGLVAEAIELTTRDFILKRLAADVKGRSLESFVSHLLQVMGYHTMRGPKSTKSTDGGIDLIAHRDHLGLEPPIIKVQVKSGTGSVGDHDVSSLYGKVSTGEYGLFITLGSFTNPAKSFAAGKTNLRLVNGDELIAMILGHYETFDTRHKGLLPLKKVYVPEPLDGGKE